MTHWREADRFTVAEGVIVSDIRFWDLEGLPGAFSGSVLWEIRANSAANTPGVLLYTGAVSTAAPASLTRVATGRRAFFVNYPEYVNTFSIPSIPLAAGTYWLVLHNGPLSNNTGLDLFWEGAINVSTDPSYKDEAPFPGTWRSNSTTGAPLSKLAFRLFGVPETARPSVRSIDRTNERPRVTFTTASGQTYRVEYKNALTEAGWDVVAGAENVAGTGSEVTIEDSDPSAPSVSRRFYRVMLNTAPPPPPTALNAPPSPPSAGDRRSSSGPAPENSLRARRQSLPLAR